MTDFLKYLVSCCSALALLELLFVHVGFRTAEGKNTEKNETVKIKKQNYIKMLFYDLPKNIGADMARRNPNEFREHGIIIFEGEQGAGKTSSMVQYALELKKHYPRAKLMSNIAVKGQDKAIQTPMDFINEDNGIYGNIIILDECQQVWNSKNSLNLDSSITGFLTSQRKRRTLILCTAQKFYMLTKDLRCNARELRTVSNIAGNLNCVMCKKPIFDSMGEIKKYKFKKFYMFTQTQELRESYDTRELVKSLSKNGLKVKTERE